LFKVRLAYRPLNKLLKVTLSPYLNRRFNIHYEDEAIRDLKAPFIVVANHQTNWDPFILSCKIQDPVHFVTSVQQFRSPIMRFLLGLAGSIPKTKSMSDSTAVRGILKIRDLKGNIGIFPEGKRCWDGRTEPILYPTAKVIRQLKLPVVSVLFQGGYLSHPRWARKSRKGEMHLTYRLLLNGDEVGSLSADEIYRRICEALWHDEYQWQAEKRTPYLGKGLAEDLELALFLCPKCHSVGKLVSKGDHLTCTQCGEVVRYNAYGYFEKDVGEPAFHTVYEWNQWQLSQLSQMIKERLHNPEMPVFEDRDITLFTAESYKPLRRIARGRLSLRIDGILFTPERGSAQFFGMDALSGVSTHLRNRFDFYHHGEFYRVAFNNRHCSANKWSEAYDRIQLAIHGLKPLSPEGGSL